jgi:hypothetical protein
VATIKPKEPQAVLIIKKQKVSLFIDTVTSISAIPFSHRLGPQRKLLFRAYQASP